MNKSDAEKNYRETLEQIGYVSRAEAQTTDYERIGFLSGLEVHQQLDTRGKLFCRCPAGVYHGDDDFDAEVIRHMRPTLSELGEYDGTALMEFKTRKDITYRLNNESVCTYEVDDTPPFPIDKEALEIALKISLLCSLNIVGEVHITRKQYLDGSIPTGFQRTAILGVNGEIQLRKKKVRLIQLSIEEDSCREISDTGHSRIYKTDRLGMPLIETVTYPDLVTPDELAEAAEYIRFLNRSTGLVRTGMGAGREDVNVSCQGGTRVEIKGVAHNKWIPTLSHNEAFRQWALLAIRDELKQRKLKPASWKMSSREFAYTDTDLLFPPIRAKLDADQRVLMVNLPGFSGLLSHFTQPGQCFADEISQRLRVIACIDQPNMTHSEDWSPQLEESEFNRLLGSMDTHKNDAQILFWGPDADIATALETIEERCLMAMEGVPPETRKSMPDGTTIFERVLPGSDRMYPDTDSAPIPLDSDYIDALSKNLPPLVSERIKQLAEWGVPEDTWTYLLSKNLLPLIDSIHADFGFDRKFLAVFLGQTFKRVEGVQARHKNFIMNKVYELFRYLSEKQLEARIAAAMIPLLYEFPDMQFSSILESIKFKPRKMEEILAPIEFLLEKFRWNGDEHQHRKAINWLMGQIHHQALGNVDLAELHTRISDIVKEEMDS